MLPVGSNRPSIYILGDNPGPDEDDDNLPLTGKSLRRLEDQFSENYWRREIRTGNIIRCLTEGDPMAPTECCRNLVAGDIAAMAPSVVVGMGKAPLTWATGLGSIDAWRGRTIVTDIGGHDCWFYPVFHPRYVLSRAGKYSPSEHEHVFENDMRWLQANIDKLPKPRVYKPPYDDGLTYITAEGGQRDFNALEDALNKLAREPNVGIDLETNGYRPYQTNPMIYLCAIGTFDNTVVFPMDYPDTWSGTLRKKVWCLLADFLLSSGRKIAHHLGFELEWLTYFYGRKLAHLTEWEDTMGQAHTLDERQGTLNLDDLCRQHFGFFLKAQSKVDAGRLLEFSLHDGMRYNGMDTKWTQLLHTVQGQRIKAVPAYQSEYERKLRLTPALVFTQQKGILVDIAYANKMQQDLATEVASLEKRIGQCAEVVKYKNAYGVFSPTSPDHVLKLMKDICKRPEVQKDGGGFTSDEGALSKISAKEVPSAALILEHRGITKLQSTYIDPLLPDKSGNPGKNVCSDGKIHCRFGCMVADTGRLNSEEPNMQNFPKRKHKKIRGVIVPPAGSWLVAIDYGQIEARVIAMASEDEALCRALWTSYDIHGFWADRFMSEHPRIKDRMIEDYKIDGDDIKLVRKKFRDEIKNGWVFPQFFGSAITSCAANLQVPIDVAEDLGAEFWDEFVGVKRWQERIIKFYHKHLYIETLTKRRRRGVLSKNQLINTPIQGTAADIVTESMAELSEVSVMQDIEELQPDLNVHDDLTFGISDGTLETRLAQIAPIMCRHRFDFINVPLIIEVSVGPRWNELEEIQVYRSNELFNIQSPYA